jgi:PAS domain S-box-containing protein
MTKNMMSQHSTAETLQIMGAAIASSMNAIALADLAGRLTYVNPAFLAMWNCQAHDALGKSAAEFWQHPHRAVQIIAGIQETDFWQGELTALRPDGSTFEVQLSATLVRDAQGQPLCMMGIFLDVTEQTQAETALRRNSRALAERVKEMRLLYSLSALKDRSEITTEQFLQEATELLPSGWQYPDDAYAKITVHDRTYATRNYGKTPWQQQTSIISGGKSVGEIVVGYQTFHPDREVSGERFPDDGTPFLVEERRLIDEIARSIGRFLERKQARDALLESEARYRELFENSPIALFEQDFSAVMQRIQALRQEGITDFRAFFKDHPKQVAELISLVRILALNKASLKLYGAETKQDLLIDLDALVPPEAHHLFVEELVWIAEGRTAFVWEGVNLKLSGNRFNIRLRWSAVPGHEESLKRVLVSIEDITARKQAESALQASEARYRAVSELTSDFAYAMCVLASGDLQLEWVTDALTRITGFTQADLDQLNSWIDLVHPEDRPKATQMMASLLAGEAVTSEFRFQTRWEETRSIRHLIRPEWDDQKERVVRILGAGQDITEYRHMEEEMIRAERLAAMGQITATLAHEVKNPLQAIQSNLELISHFPLEEDEREECLRICWQEVKHLQDITQNVLSLSRLRREGYQLLSISDICKRTQELLSQPLQNAQVALEMDLEANLPSVMGSPDQLAQVLLNLALNAIESMPNGGELEIHGSTQHDRLVLSVTNTGPQIPPENLDRLFEPFFTTKPGGTGLGLFVSHTIILQHDGTLSVTNLPNDRGVRFTITLPLAAEAVGQQEGTKSPD